MATPHSMKGCHCPGCETHRTYMREYMRRRPRSATPKRPKRAPAVRHESRTAIEQRIALGWSDEGIAEVLGFDVAEVATVRQRMDKLVNA